MSFARMGVSLWGVVLVWAGAALSQENQPLMSAGHGPATCLQCHGPARDRQGRPNRLLTPQGNPEKMMEVCLTCHAASPMVSQFLLSPHAEGRTTCFSCHRIHTKAFVDNYRRGGEAPAPSPMDVPEVWPQPAPDHLLKMSAPQLCFQCHRSVASEFRRPYRHPIVRPANAREPQPIGFLSCASCHNPHEAKTERTDWESGSVERCGACHADKATMFEFSHGALREEGCLLCHQQHASSRHRLLRANVELTCRQCHRTISSTHDRRARGSCTTCHPAFHGSHLSGSFQE